MSELAGSWAAVAAGAGAAVVLLGAPRPRLASTGSAGSTRTPDRRRVLLGAIGGAVLVAVAAGPRAAVLVALAAAAVKVGLDQARRRRRDRAAEARRSRVIDLCEAVGAELSAGQTAIAALERAAGDWPLIAPAARAAASGGDTVGELRRLAREPGAGALRLVAAAWQVSARTGHGLADTLARVADDLRAAEQTRRIVGGELASARATARLLAVLPLLAMAMGAGAGASPWAFLLGQPIGLACLAAGGGLTAAGLAWIDALARGIEADS